VIKSNEGCSLRIHVVGKDGIRPKFPKAIKVQLPGKTRKVAMLEILGQNITGELFHILNDEIVSRRRPSCDVLIALIDHVVSFAQKQRKLMLFGASLDFRSFAITSTRSTSTAVSRSRIDRFCNGYRCRLRMH